MTDYTDPDGPPPPMMSCERCAHVLTLSVAFEDLVLDGEVVDRLQVPTWSHPGGIDFDHDPVPVPSPSDMADAAALCDFCSSPNVAGYAHCTPFVTVHREIEHRDNGVWACCADCRGLLEHHKGNKLVARVTKILTDKHGTEHAEAVTALVTGFIRHFTGEIVDGHTRPS